MMRGCDGCEVSTCSVRVFGVSRWKDLEMEIEKDGESLNEGDARSSR